MAESPEFSTLAINEAYSALQLSRRERLLIETATDRANLAATRATEIYSTVTSLLAASGFQARWIDDQLEVKSAGGAWIRSPHLKGSTGDRGPIGRWLGDVAMIVGRQRLNNASGEIIFDLATYNEFDVYLTGNVSSIQFINKPAATRAVRWAVYFWQDAQGGRALEGWPSMAWGGGGVPLISPEPNIGSLLIFDTPGDDTPSRGFIVDNSIRTI